MIIFNKIIQCNEVLALEIKDRLFLTIRQKASC